MLEYDPDLPALHGPATIKNVARAAGVSVATVSRALQMPGRVAPDTRAKVSAAVERLGYTPNVQARNLRTAKTSMIVALVPDISNCFFAGVIRGIEDVATRNGYSVLLGDIQDDVSREQRYSDMISARVVDGMITLLPRVPKIQWAGRLPIVNACEYVDDPAITSVYVNNEAAAGDATRYLLTLGHRQIAFIGGQASSPISIDRKRGYEQALLQAGVTPSRKLCAQGDFSMAAGVRGVELIFAAGEPFTAVLCASDEIAIGVLQAAKARGFRVPQDLSIIGFDNIIFSQYMDPPLTTVAQPQEDLGREAMMLLLNIFDEQDIPPCKRILSTQLVVRGSTGPEPRQAYVAD